MLETEITEYREFLNKVDTLVLIEKIEKFNKLNINNLTCKELSDSLFDVLWAGNDSDKEFLFTPNLTTYPKGTLFYRARYVGDLENFPRNKFLEEKECWNPPKELVEMGRLNHPEESLLYTAPTSQEIAILETKIPEDEWFILMTYKANAVINLATIGNTNPFDWMTPDEQVKYKLINKFLKDEFIRDVGKGNEFLYRTSNLIAKTFFNWGNKIQDAWCYPSIARKEGRWNVCFRGNGIPKIDLIGMEALKYIKDGEVYKTGHDSIALPDGTGNMTFHEIGSKAQIHHYPHLKKMDE